MAMAAYHFDGLVRFLVVGWANCTLDDESFECQAVRKAKVEEFCVVHGRLPSLGNFISFLGKSSFSHMFYFTTSRL